MSDTSARRPLDWHACSARPTLATVSPTLAAVNFGHFRGTGGEGKGRVREWGEGEGWGSKQRKTVGPEGLGPKRWGSNGGRGGPNQKKGGARRVEAQRVGGLQGGRGPKFRAFFPSPAPIFIFSLSGDLLVSFFLSLEVFSWNFCGVLVGWDLKCACFRPRVEAPGGLQAAWVSQDSLRAKTSTFEVPTDQNTTKIPREDLQRERKKDTREKK